jgi:hypothetical protein
MSLSNMFVKITMTIRTCNIILINKMNIKKRTKDNHLNQPDGTSLGRKTGNGPPSLIARVTVRASRIESIAYAFLSNLVSTWIATRISNISK